MKTRKESKLAPKLWTSLPEGCVMVMTCLHCQKSIYWSGLLRSFQHVKTFNNQCFPDTNMTGLLAHPKVVYATAPMIKRAQKGA